MTDPLPPPHPVAASKGLKQIDDSVNEAASRLTVLEERMRNLRRKTQVTEQTLIDYEQETRADLKAFTQTVTDLARRVEEVKERIDAIAGELSTVVKRPDFTVLERYMDLWQPLDFVTREEAKLLIERAKRGNI